ncbi:MULTISPECIES: hypothetical protein [Rhodococcus]|uniref:hypothetical protein n=1 Tax=Rhodococcus TaxID=1827 RepID=UPI000519FDE2|nr:MULTISPECIES: hypothetical protein [Rhodococcus]AOD22565.1 hypothetical protein IM25_13885 [Rhodococcus sp. p52]APE08545.1 hypothetical protein BO226_04335 [Rhodococcus sp. 2G]MCD2098585.1 hypothetical protein [Rhodococcus rhodochrous]MCD2122935.1 hypothetical protein [Rhodococcus rhodochrous]MCQ4136504.1 hypothetical protein [Rhodococcus rhodochrous]
MTKTSRALRAAAVVAMGGAAAFAGAGTATAAPIDIQPTPLLCPAGIAETQSLTYTENKAVEGDELFYAINQKSVGGATVSWINVNTGATGNATLESNPAVFGVPTALTEPEAGTVLSAIWGMHENEAGEQCFLLPGIDIAQVPGETDD